MNHSACLQTHANENAIPVMSITCRQFEHLTFICYFEFCSIHVKMKCVVRSMNLAGLWEIFGFRAVVVIIWKMCDTISFHRNFYETTSRKYVLKLTK